MGQPLACSHRRHPAALPLPKPCHLNQTHCLTGPLAETKHKLGPDAQRNQWPVLKGARVNCSVSWLKAEHHSHCWCQLYRSQTSNETTALGKWLLILGMTVFGFKYLRTDLETSLSISNIRWRKGEGHTGVQHLKFRPRESKNNHSNVCLSFEVTHKNVALDEVQKATEKRL